jgi:hypothetical protein
MWHREKNSIDEGLTIICYKSRMNANLAYKIPICQKSSILLNLSTLTSAANYTIRLLAHAIFLPLNKCTAIHGKAR